uniref:Nuclear inhibitor of protein phosphatase 1 n=1 Tax=Monopterus albus TaxID=43700 RepID=A0A3Q3Q8X8_MONAL|nr:nuclear inhibitor of protein phosphatase 1-like [Monopterus albus]XP_020462083.1 nuclear inhibitor of protein phosphatase 1-like [Monopterus albus]XP_020462084.1 nuclear inhibitor of protein phosphatase 1-like [Monopterus albus]
MSASTHVYILGEKPQTQGSIEEEGLPETELDNLTESNTTHNKHISSLTIEEGDLDIQRPKRRRSSHVSFSDEEEIINLEDVEPSVGCFRNMIQTAFVPKKKKKTQDHSSLGLEAAVCGMHGLPVSGSLYGDLPPTSHEGATHHHTASQGPAAILGGLPVPLPNLDPDMDVTPTLAEPPITLNSSSAPGPYTAEPLNEPHKKKYAKEAWPGKKPASSLLI